ncbi:hypothetical protein ADL26_15395, partial [Thermoactinomyces vulgaris]
VAHGLALQLVLLEAHGEDAADLEDEQEDDDRPDAGEGDVPHPPPAVRAVRGRRFIEARIDGGEGGQEDDHAPAGVLPGPLQPDQEQEGVGVGGEVEAFAAGAQEPVRDEAVGTEDLHEDGDDQDPR